MRTNEISFVPDGLYMNGVFRIFQFAVLNFSNVFSAESQIVIKLLEGAIENGPISLSSSGLTGPPNASAAAFNPDLCEFGPKQKDERGVIQPYEQDHH
jgi:hypothetical protein